MQKTLIIIGAMVLLTGLFWPWMVKIPLGRLPGDILINRPGLKVYIPVTSMVLVSVLVSVILWLLRK